MSADCVGASRKRDGNLLVVFSLQARVLLIRSALSRRGRVLQRALQLFVQRGVHCERLFELGVRLVELGLQARRVLLELVDLSRRRLGSGLELVHVSPELFDLALTFGRIELLAAFLVAVQFLQMCPAR